MPMHQDPLLVSLSHCTGAGVVSVAMSSSLAALEVVISTTYGAASDESARGWRPFRFSEPPYIIVTMARCVRGGSQWDQFNLTVTSLCVSCRSHYYLFACYYHFMLRLFILCYLCRTIALVATVICWLYPTLNKFYLVLSLSYPMMTPSNGSIFRITEPLCGNSPLTSEFPSQRPVTRSFDVFFDLRLNKQLRKQLRRRWFETPSHSIWPHCNVKIMTHLFPNVLSHKQLW